MTSSSSTIYSNKFRKLFNTFINCCCTLPLPRIYIPPRRISECMTSNVDAILYVQGTSLLLLSGIIRYALCTVTNSFIDNIFLGWNDIITSIIIMLFRRGGCQSSGSWLILVCIWGPLSVLFNILGFYSNITSSNWITLKGSKYTYWIINNILLILCGILLQLYLIIKCYKLIKDLIPDWTSTLAGDDPRYDYGLRLCPGEQPITRQPLLPPQQQQAFV